MLILANALGDEDAFEFVLAAQVRVGLKTNLRTGAGRDDGDDLAFDAIAFE
ncbi:MAG: hypothetical protein KF767_18065 [Bdellovibrionaceae bacterium]|nr:hypothetical protein [Pseudobdellovibrionaceae bacterium]